MPCSLPLALGVSGGHLSEGDFYPSDSSHMERERKLCVCVSQVPIKLVQVTGPQQTVRSRIRRFKCFSRRQAFLHSSLPLFLSFWLPLRSSTRQQLRSFHTKKKPDLGNKSSSVRWVGTASLSCIVVHDLSQTPTCEFIHSRPPTVQRLTNNNQSLQICVMWYVLFW